MTAASGEDCRLTVSMPLETVSEYVGDGPSSISLNALVSVACRESLSRPAERLRVVEVRTNARGVECREGALPVTA